VEALLVLALAALWVMDTRNKKAAAALTVSAPDGEALQPVEAPITPKKPVFTLGKGLRAAILAAVCLLLVVGVGTALWMVNEQRYDRTVACLDQKDYDKALQAQAGTFMFYRDTRDLYAYLRAGSSLKQGEYDQAKAAFTSLGAYRDASTMVKECDYQKSTSLLSQGKIDEAKAGFVALADYSDAPTQVEECDYQNAALLLGKGEYDTAKAAFLALSDYSDATKKAEECDYQKANGLYADKEYLLAKTLYLSLGEYSDSGDKAMDCDYQIGIQYYDSYSKSQDKADIKEALALFKSLGSFRDSTSYFEKCQTAVYLKGVDQMKEDFDSAEGYFELIKDYKDSTKYIDTIKALEMGTVQGQYDELLKLWDFQPAQDILVTLYTEYLLIGDWEGQNCSFSLKKNGQGMNCVCTLPLYNGGHFFIQGGIL
jgi:TolA-binding protein